LKQLNQLRGQSGAGAPAAPKPSAGGPPAAASTPAGARSTVFPSAAQKESGTRKAATPPAPEASAAVLVETIPVFAGLTELWAKLIEAVGHASPFTRSYLVDANPVLFEKNILTIGFDPEFEDHLGLVDNARNHALLQTKLAELGHPNAQIKFVKVEASAGRTTQPARVASAAPAAREKSAAIPINKNDFKNDPLIQKALEIFKGQIVEVRA
jgi:hypothetical protein